MRYVDVTADLSMYMEGRQRREFESFNFLVKGSYERRLLGSFLSRHLKKNRQREHRMRISFLSRPMSTGERSQNNRIHGHCRFIAEEFGEQYSTVKEHIKHLAVSMGYPVRRDSDGNTIVHRWEQSPYRGEPVPLSVSDATKHDASILIEAIHVFAAEYGILLPESYD